MRPIWVDRILMEPALKSDLYKFFNERRATMQQYVLDEVRRGSFHEAALATGRVEGMDILYKEILKYEREDGNDVKLLERKKGG